MPPAPPITYRRWSGPIAGAVPLLQALSARVFEEYSPAYLPDRIGAAADPLLWLAERDGNALGFKLGYRRGPKLLLSWLGGVAPEARRMGVASALMVRQHQSAREAGYRFVETRTRAPNNAMLILNLRHGFHIVGAEIDPRGFLKVIQRKELTV
ncbi:GNAT family N-acetyltransferase [Sphingomonas canadensis]|uniref:GNAT family N-acetyltransferase n=1 Tax=Sphingomonas canadensis TaxID=1219257 RepID=A0ABW3H6R2_9SPHN|nr:GNAT family N-acetyltransferase [Sphingomonas canadensis]MCW3836881.1 GNAT family N-acetyltransferase [Sphingomonas canadensis]